MTTQENTAPARSTFEDRAGRVLAFLSTLALIAMMLVTVVSVLMRYVVGTPILGVNELTQVVSVALVMFAMPYATQQDAHVRVDVLDPWLGRWGRWAGDLLARAIICYVLWVLLRRGWLRMRDAFEFGDVTNMLQLPLGPFYAVMLFGFALTLAVLLLQIVTLLRRRRAIND